MNVENCTYIEDINVKDMYRIHWGYEHGLSFYSLSWLKAIANGKSTYQAYSGIDINLSSNSVQFYIEGSFGVDSPSINLPADPVLLRDIASICTTLASQIELKNLKRN
jgi:hypothetical protein